MIKVRMMIEDGEVQLEGCICKVILDIQRYTKLLAMEKRKGVESYG